MLLQLLITTGLTPLPATPSPSGEAVAPSAHSVSASSELVWGDFDGDGRRDSLQVSPDGRLRLLVAGRTAELVDRTLGSGLEQVRDVRLALAEDYDGDGRDDLFLVLDSEADGRGVLLRAGEDATFAEATEDLDLARVRFAEWIDFDGDGRVDLFTTGASGLALHRNTVGGFVEVPLELDPEFQLSITGNGGHSVLSRKLRDTASSGQYLRASSRPELGRLYPVSNDWFVDAANGRVGLGNVDPATTLDVNGVVRSRSAGLVFPDNTTQTTATLPGAAGAVGPAGAQGPTGPAGPAGAVGPQGPAGAAGLPGEVGPAGPTGAAGAPGPAGPTGPTGPQGPQGPDGGAASWEQVGPHQISSVPVAVGPQSEPQVAFQIDSDNTGLWIDPSSTGVDLVWKAWSPGAKELSVWMEHASLGHSRVATFGAGSLLGHLGIGGSPQREVDVNGVVRSSAGGIVFGDGTVQTTATVPLGPAGDAGEPGPMGPQGPTGPEGPEGSAGPIGPKGPDGPPGARGPLGPTGPQGPDGPTGPGGAGYWGTQHAYVTGIDFQAEDSIAKVLSMTTAGLATHGEDGSNAPLIGALHLPHGAVIHSFVVYGRDAHSLREVRTGLKYLTHLDPGGSTELATHLSQGQPGTYTGSQSGIDHTVDLTLRQYFVEVRPEGGPWESSGTMGILAAVVEYTLD